MTGCYLVPFFLHSPSPLVLPLFPPLWCRGFFPITMLPPVALTHGWDVFLVKRYLLGP